MPEVGGQPLALGTASRHLYAALLKWGFFVPALAGEQARFVGLCRPPGRNVHLTPSPPHKREEEQSLNEPVVLSSSVTPDSVQALSLGTASRHPVGFLGLFLRLSPGPGR